MSVNIEQNINVDIFSKSGNYAQFDMLAIKRYESIKNTYREERNIYKYRKVILIEKESIEKSYILILRMNVEKYWKMIFITEEKGVLKNDNFYLYSCNKSLEERERKT